jgi:L-xylulokinase
VAQHYLLGIDNGGTVAKAALFTRDGREVGVASCKCDSRSPQAGWFEFDAEQLWQATASAVRQMLADTGIDSRDIAGIACTGHGNGLYLVDAAGRPVRAGIYSADSRAGAIVRQWLADGVDRRVQDQTMQTLWPGQPNALLAWLQQHAPDTHRHTRWVLMCKDYIRLRLTGEARAELTDMSGTSLMNVATGQYDPEVLAAFGISEWAEKLPPLCLSSEACGAVTTEAAAQTGLAEGTPVVGGLFDVDACALSSALTEDSQLGMILGTWGINQYVSTEPVPGGQLFMTTRYCIPGYYLMLEGSATSASNLEWFLAQFFQAEAQAASEQGQTVYQVINRLVAETSPRDAELLFFPFLYGSNMAPEASGTLLGMRARYHRGHVLRAIYEGVAFGHRTHLDRLLKVREMPARIRVSGGAARSDVWMQILADVFQRPVDVPDGSELGALGAAIAAAVGIGWYPSYPAACAAMVRLTRVFQPNPDLAEVYQAKYRRYTRFLELMEPAWSELG